MGKSRTSKCVFEFAAVAFTIFSLGEAVADDATSLVNPGFDPTMPPEFNLAKISGQGTLFQNCNGGLQNAVQQGLQDLGKLAQDQASGRTQGGFVPGSMGFGINAVCPGTDVGPSADSLSCTTLAPGGVMNIGMFRAKAQALDLALANIQCRKGKFDAVSGELKCLTSQADALSQQLSSIQGAYQTNIQRMQQDVQKIDSVISDRTAQDVDVLSKLNGSGGSDGAAGNGSKGLIGVRDALKAALTSGDDAIPNQIQKLKDQMVIANNLHKSFDESIQQRTMGLAGECFNSRPHSEFRCVPNGPPVTAKDYVICRYQQNQTLGDNGQVEQSQILSSQANANTQGLGGLLDQILGEVPQKKAPGAPGQPDLDPGTASTLLTAADVESQYGDQLDKYNGKGLDIHDFVMKQMSTCFQRATRTVEREKTMKSSALGLQQAQMTMTDDGLKTQANTMIEGNSLKWSEAMTALTGMNLPLNTGACKDSAPNVQIACLQDLQRNMEGLLQGNVKQSTVSMVIKGSDPRTSINFNCQGLNGCIAALQNVDRNLGVEKQRLSTFRQSYVTRAKQTVDNFTKQMAAMMSGQGAALSNRLKGLNSALASLGVGGGISIPPVKGEVVTFDDKTGLPNPPQSALQLIGGQMNPPMLDVSGNDFSSALSNVSQGVTALNDKRGPLQEAKDRLAMLPSECGGGRVSKLLDRAQADSDQIASGNCQWSEEFCKQGSKLSDLMSTLSGMEGVGISPDAVASVGANLQAGIDGCAQNQAQTSRVKTYNKCVDDYNADPKSAPACGPSPLGVATAASYCSSISGRLRRDVGSIGVASGNRGDSSSGGAQ